MTQLKHIFITDPLESLIPNHDSSLAMMREGYKLGQRIFQTELNDITWNIDHVKVNAHEIEYEETSKRFSKKTQAVFNLSDSPQTVLWMRKDPPVDDSYIRACQLLRLSNAPVINDPNSLITCNEKLFTLQFPKLTPKTYVLNNIKEIKELLQIERTLVAKPIAGKAGEGILVLNEGDKNVSSMLEFATERGKHKIILQEFLPEVTKGDKRIFLLAGEPIGALNRLPTSSDYRANMAAGGTIAKAEITDSDRKICEALKPELLRLGLFIVGLDVIGNRLTEINITSPTCLEEIANFNNTNPAKQIIEWACNKFCL